MAGVKLAEVRVLGIGAGGVGVGNLPDGRIVFLPRTAPGDLVHASVVQTKNRWARGETLSLLEPGRDRRVAPCPRYEECHGCALQHLDYSAQTLWKSRIVGDALRRIGGLRVQDPPVVASPREFQYRNRATMVLRRLRGGRIVAGFRKMKDRRRLLDIGPECLLLSPDLALLWEGLRRHWGPGADHLPEGRELRLTVRCGAGGDGALVIRGGSGDGRPAELLQAVPPLASVWKVEKHGRVRHLGGEERLELSWLGERLGLSGTSFLQVNQGAGEALHRYVLERIGDVKDARVVEGYSGVGILGRKLAREGAQVVAIEIDGEAVSHARCGAPEGFDAVQGRVEEILPGLLPADLVILNPPRAGLSPEIPPVLTRTPSSRVVYVSCDPATLARDLNRLRGRFEVTDLGCFDLFPQTGHVETVVFLKRLGE